MKTYRSLFTGIFSICIIALLFSYFRSLSPFIFQTNDDPFLKMILSGEMTGTPCARSFYISYFRSSPGMGCFFALSFF